MHDRSQSTNFTSAIPNFSKSCSTISLASAQLAESPMNKLIINKNPKKQLSKIVSMSPRSDDQKSDKTPQKSQVDPKITISPQKKAKISMKLPTAAKKQMRNQTMMNNPFASFKNIEKPGSRMLPESLKKF